jgi:hypothetical protein
VPTALNVTVAILLSALNEISNTPKLLSQFNSILSVQFEGLMSTVN